MAQINYIVSNKATSPGRLGTQQSYTLKIISKFDRPQIDANRNYKWSMDRKSGQGTLINSSETFVMDIIYDDSEIPQVDELLYSLFDYQEAELDGTDIPKLGAVKDFVLDGNSWTTETVGCTGNRLTLNGTFIG